MSNDKSFVQSADFVELGGSSRLRFVSCPASGSCRGTVVFVHAFAEEMNKSRRMAALAARRMAGAGWQVVQRDLFGCGDSSGEFADADWQSWLEDVDDEVQRAPAHLPLWLWSQRAGALLLTRALQRRPRVNLLLWQPVLSGEQHLQQFLRLHAGARIIGAARGNAQNSPMEMLHSGQTVEVGGYRLSPALAQGLSQAALQLPAEFDGRVVWLEVSRQDDLQPSLASQRMIAQWRERGVEVRAQVLAGDPFWQTQEIEECPALIEATADALRSDTAQLTAA